MMKIQHRSVACHLVPSGCTVVHLDIGRLQKFMVGDLPAAASRRAIGVRREPVVDCARIGVPSLLT